MKILLLLASVALANADVSHLVNQQQQGFSGYNYNSPAQSSYSAPQGSVVGSLSGHTDAASSHSIPSVNFVQYSQQQQLPSTGYQFSSQYSQSAGNNVPQFGSLNSAAPSADFGAGSSQGSSGFNFGAASGVNQAQATNFGQSSSGSNGAAFDFGAGVSQGSSGANYGQSNGQASFDFGAGVSQGSAGANYGQSNGQASFNFGAGGIQQTSGFGSGGSAYQGKTSGGSIDESFGVVTDAAAGASSSAAADVAKHLYFFSAPEEEDEVIQAKYDYPAVPAKKTYKIIFIKAPTYKNQATITIPAPPQNEEKTLVYVLVKKPEGQPKVHFKEAAPTQPSKPEVFFIKYKTQKEAEAAVAEIQSKHGASGQVIANLPAGTQAALQSPDGSIVHNPSHVDIGALSGIGGAAGYAGSVSGGSSSSGNYGGSVNGASSISGGYGGSVNGASSSSGSYGGSASGASSSSGGFSLDSLGANSFVGATVDSRISGQVEEQDSEQHGANVQVTADQGLVAQSPTPVTFGQSSVDSLQVFGGGIANAVSSSGSVSVSGSQQENSDSNVDEDVTTVIAPTGEDCCSGNVAGSDSEGQGSNVAGFSEYGLPKNKRFVRRNKY